jgi:hypothetical protein
MKAQDKFPYHSTIVGLNNVYNTVGDDSFYINSDCILVSDKTLTIGKEYFIFHLSTAPGNKMSDVLLVDCYYHEEAIHLIVEDIRGHGIFTISQCMECPEIDCPWVLVDLHFFHDLLDKKAIEKYCGCEEENKKPGHRSSLKLNEDLLDFEF